MSKLAHLKLFFCRPRSYTRQSVPSWLRQSFLTLCVPQDQDLIKSSTCIAPWEVLTWPSPFVQHFHLKHYNDNFYILLTIVKKILVMIVRNIFVTESLLWALHATSEMMVTTAVTRGHFDAWSTDQEFPIIILIWQTRFTEIAVSRKL